MIDIPVDFIMIEKREVNIEGTKIVKKYCWLCQVKDN